MEHKRYTVSDGHLIDEEDCIEIILSISQQDWGFYKELLSIKKEDWVIQREMTEKGPVAVIKSYKPILV